MRGVEVASEYGDRFACGSDGHADRQAIEFVSVHAPIRSGRVSPHLATIFDDVEARLQFQRERMAGDLRQERPKRPSLGPEVRRAPVSAP